MTPLDKAIAFFNSKAGLARAVGVVPMAVSSWSKRQVPVERAIQIEKLTRGEVTAAELRPDVFGIAVTKAADAA